jgi:hypothetical protein
MTTFCEHCHIPFVRQLEEQTLCNACRTELQKAILKLADTEAYLPMQLSYLPLPDVAEPGKDTSRPPIFITVEKDEPVP